VRIAPCYGNVTIHVKDASRCVGVVERLMKPASRKDLDRENRDAQEKDRESFRKRRERKLVSYAEAKAKRFQIDWVHTEIAKPAVLGTRVIDDQPLEVLVPYIDWSPFFMSWELKGKYPEILKDPHVGKEARDLFSKAQTLLSELMMKQQVRANGVYGFFPANSDGDDIVLYTDESRVHEVCRMPMLRQQWEREGQTNFRGLADYVAPVESGRHDYIGAFAVTAGHGVKDLVEAYKNAGDDYNAIMVEALADRLAEAFAEYLHKKVRQKWGYGVNENLSNEDLIDAKYRGIRPASGYPSCPDHTEKGTLWKLLNVEHLIGMQLTESYAMWPAASVSGLYFAHPEARYFAVDMITRDQVEDYARRKGMTIAEVERWLQANLAYETQ
jgi:5-methyltetrahydrofolate--homocysteine methyltransferase